MVLPSRISIVYYYNIEQYALHGCDLAYYEYTNYLNCNLT